MRKLAAGGTIFLAVLVLAGCPQMQLKDIIAQIVAAAATSQSGRFSADADTVGLWHFDEGSGQAVADSSSSAWNLTLGSDGTVETADPAWSAIAKSGYSLAFTQAESDYVCGPGRSAFSANKVTIEFWIRTASTLTSAPVRSGMFLYTQLNTDGRLQASFGNGASWGADVMCATPINDNSWHYVAIVYDGTAGGGTLTIYVDGAPDASRSSYGIIVTDPPEWYIGGRPSNTFLDGNMDEVRVSNSARSATEIAANFY